MAASKTIRNGAYAKDYTVMFKHQHLRNKRFYISDGPFFDKGSGEFDYLIDFDYWAGDRKEPFTPCNGRCSSSRKGASQNNVPFQIQQEGLIQRNITGRIEFKVKFLCTLKNHIGSVTPESFSQLEIYARSTIDSSRTLLFTVKFYPRLMSEPEKKIAKTKRAEANANINQYDTKRQEGGKRRSSSITFHNETPNTFEMKRQKTNQRSPSESESDDSSDGQSIRGSPEPMDYRRGYPPSDTNPDMFSGSEDDIHKGSQHYTFINSSFWNPNKIQLDSALLKNKSIGFEHRYIQNGQLIPYTDRLFYGQVDRPSRYFDGVDYRLSFEMVIILEKGEIPFTECTQRCSCCREKNNCETTIPFLIDTLGKDIFTCENGVIDFNVRLSCLNEKHNAISPNFLQLRIHAITDTSSNHICTVDFKQAAMNEPGNGIPADKRLDQENELQLLDLEDGTPMDLSIQMQKLDYLISKTPELFKPIPYSHCDLETLADVATLFGDETDSESESEDDWKIDMKDYFKSDVLWIPISDYEDEIPYWLDENGDTRDNPQRESGIGCMGYDVFLSGPKTCRQFLALLEAEMNLSYNKIWSEMVPVNSSLTELNLSSNKNENDDVHMLAEALANNSS
eukprot:TRINITY_DN7645_c0_g1_i1.p1 TRINITY_DN7645_c0_g1~~TRINITY_DN7645_c0_g1_i1.p1  ORF type:complete len:622 (-),score=117.94 TRINITY_DN7645_c0_g1_i1:902-2767(-)